MTKNAKTFTVYTPQDLNISILNLDPSYQRDLYSHFVEKTIAANFDPLAFGRLTVALRKDNTFWVVDGQHRLAAAKSIGYKAVPCDVFNSNGAAHEAEVFTKVNGKKRMISPFDVWRSCLTAMDTQALNIASILHRHGFVVVQKGKAWNQIQAVRAVITTYSTLGPKQFESLIEILAKSFSGKPGASNESLIKGLGLLFKEYGEKIDAHHFIKKLAGRDPMVILRAAEAKQSKVGRNLGHGYERYEFTKLILLEAYNFRCKRKLLNRSRLTCT